MASSIASSSRVMLPAKSAAAQAVASLPFASASSACSFSHASSRRSFSNQSPRLSSVPASLAARARSGQQVARGKTSRNSLLDSSSRAAQSHLLAKQQRRLISDSTSNPSSQPDGQASATSAPAFAESAESDGQRLSSETGEKDLPKSTRVSEEHTPPASAPSSNAAAAPSLIVTGKQAEASAEEAAKENPATSERELRRLRRTMLDQFQTLGSTQNRNTAFRPHQARFSPKAARELTLSHLLASQAHVGHHKSQTLRAYNPLLLGTRDSISIIDIEKHTLPALKRCAQVVRKVLAQDGIILFVATGQGQAASVLRACKRLGSNGFHVVTDRWIPGTLTNAPKLLAPAIYKSLEDAKTDVTEAPDTTKLASQTYQPDLVVVLNPRENANAVKEATEKYIPTIGIIDSNVDPRLVTYAIPGNDDSLRFVDLVVGTLARAGQEGILDGQRLRDEADRLRRKERRNSRAIPQGADEEP